MFHKTISVLALTTGVMSGLALAGKGDQGQLPSQSSQQQGKIVKIFGKGQIQQNEGLTFDELKQHCRASRSSQSQGFKAVIECKKSQQFYHEIGKVSYHLDSEISITSKVRMKADAYQTDPWTVNGAYEPACGECATLQQFSAAVNATSPQLSCDDIERYDSAQSYCDEHLPEFWADCEQGMQTAQSYGECLVAPVVDEGGNPVIKGCQGVAQAPAQCEPTTQSCSSPSSPSSQSCSQSSPTTPSCPSVSTPSCPSISTQSCSTPSVPSCTSSSTSECPSVSTPSSVSCTVPEEPTCTSPSVPSVSMTSCESECTPPEVSYTSESCSSVSSSEVRCREARACDTGGAVLRNTSAPRDNAFGKVIYGKNRDAVMVVGQPAQGTLFDQYGLKAGDTILNINGKNIADDRTAQADLHQLQGKAYKIRVLRGNKRHELVGKGHVQQGANHQVR